MLDKYLKLKISRTRWVYGLNPYTLTTFIYSNGDKRFRYETPHYIQACSIKGSESDYKGHLAFVRNLQKSISSREERLEMEIIKYNENGKIIYHKNTRSL